MSENPEFEIHTADDMQISPVRGLMLTRDHRGRPFALTDLKKWIRLNDSVFKVEKIDVFAAADGVSHLRDLLAFAHQDRIKISLRTEASCAPACLPELVAAGLFDVFLCPANAGSSGFKEWLAAAREVKIPIRVQVPPPIEPGMDIEGLAERLSCAAAVNVALYDPFQEYPRCESREEAQTAVAQMNALTTALAARGVDVNLFGLPFCHVVQENWPYTTNRLQFFLDHQQYQHSSYEFAEVIYRRGPHRLSKAVENLLARRVSVHTAIDNSLFPWIIDHPRLYIRVWMFHKLTRHLYFLRRPRPLPETAQAAEREAERQQRKALAAMGPICSQCRFRRICDHETEAFRRKLPRLRVQVFEGTPFVSPLHFLRNRKRYYDSVDEARRRFPVYQKKLAEEARHIVLREPPTREIVADDYDIEGHYTHHMPGAVRWLSFANVEHRSTLLARIEPPFTMTLTFGGGIASHIGFSFGRHARLVCPMIDYSHRLTVHVDADGHYVLLRDGVLVRPTEFEGARQVPSRLAGCLEPRISIHNIDGMILTQTLLLWEGRRQIQEDRGQIHYSVIIICTRFSRRLQAALLALAHQQEIDLQRLEVVIAYVPGIDGTDDLIDTMRLAYPELRIVRSPFAEDCVRAKGFMINESLHVASGAWIVLLDADIIVPPNLFATIDRVEAGAHFIAPDGRKMLSPETTARILLGQIRPWENFEALAAAESAYRFREADRTPIGFCQCVRREILAQIPYHELDHFESSDWWFGHSVAETRGKETRLEGLVVLHLDHGGSQWYGAPKQM